MTTRRRQCVSSVSPSGASVSTASAGTDLPRLPQVRTRHTRGAPGRSAHQDGQGHEDDEVTVAALNVLGDPAGFVDRVEDGTPPASSVMVRRLSCRPEHPD